MICRECKRELRKKIYPVMNQYFCLDCAQELIDSPEDFEIQLNKLNRRKQNER